MKSVIAIVVAAFALSAVAQGVPTPVAPAKVEAKKDAKPAKSAAPAVKDTKATVPATK